MPLIDVTPPIGIGLPVAFWPVFSPQSSANAGAAPTNNVSASAPMKSKKLCFIFPSLIGFYLENGAVAAISPRPCIELYVPGLHRVK
jgi:hypothetical protein